MTYRGKILVIDDDPAHLYMARAMLESEGYEVRTHDSPFGATKLLNEFRPDAALVDVNMPGPSGDRLAPLLIKETRAPVFLYSSNDEDALRQAVSHAGAAGYICKGDSSMLRSRLASVLTHRS